MADIFISYARDDRDRIEKLSQALETQGWSVWWDRNIESGSEFSKDIERELDGAKAVIACWSNEGSNSRWVKDEANIAAEAGKLLAITLDADQPPIGFRQYHAVDFSKWKGDAAAPAFADLTRSLKSRLSKHAPNPEHSIVPPTTKPPAARTLSKPIAMAGVVAALLVVVLISVIALRSGGAIQASDDINASAPAELTNAALNATTPEQSIAVLPFVALSNDDSDEYFGKGIAEELLNALAQFPDLKVAARTSAFSFEGQNADLRDVGEKLGVAHVLEGSVRRAGDTVRITAQLIRVSDGFHLWSETYERELTDVFAIQDEIVREISKNLQVRLGVGGGTGRAEAQSVDPRAYEQYLRGLTLWGDRDRGKPGERRNTLSAFLLATELDPDFADAWAMIGMVGSRSSFDLIGEGAETYNTRTEAAFENALRLDPDNPITLAALVGWHARHDINVESAQRHLDRVLALAPSMADTQYSASLFYSTVGDNAASLRAVEQAIAVDPLNPTLRRSRATELVIGGRASEAFDYFNECAAQNCINPLFLSVIALGSALVAGERDELRARFNTFEGRRESRQSTGGGFCAASGFGADRAWRRSDR